MTHLLSARGIKSPRSDALGGLEGIFDRVLAESRNA